MNALFANNLISETTEGGKAHAAIDQVQTQGIYIARKGGECLCDTPQYRFFFTLTRNS